MKSNPKRIKYCYFKLLLLVITIVIKNAQGQLVPSSDSNIDFLVTFSNSSEAKWGDDDHCQTYFFAIPTKQTSAFFIRVFDPEISGLNDQVNGEFNSVTNFSIYGGLGAYSDARSRNVDPIAGYDAGILLDSKSFEKESNYDNNWYSFGPFNPKQGEYDKDLDAYVFKIIAKGGNGDDGNMYRYFTSSSNSENTAIEGCNAFSYEVSFRVTKLNGKKAHFYPFVEKNIVAVTQNNFDFDNDELRVTSVAKKSQLLISSSDGNWESSTKIITPEELNTSLDLQIIKKTDFDNDMVIFLTNQYKEALKFYNVPIGGIPRYHYKIEVSKSIKGK